MDKLKEFIKKKKIERKFKQAGPGQVLQGTGQPQHQHGSSSSSRSGSREQQQQSSAANIQVVVAPTRPDISAIAQAAERRMNKGKPNSQLTQTQKMIRMQAKKELDEEQRKLTDQMSAMKAKEREVTHSPAEFVPSVLFTCELFDEEIALPKSEMLEAIESCLIEHFNSGESNLLDSSILMLYTLNKEEPRKIAIETIEKYIQNIITNPQEQKFQQIRMSNRVFKERVASVKGAIEYMKAIGFHEEELSGEDGKEQFLVINNIDANALSIANKALLEGKKIPIRVFRDRKVFFIDPAKPIPLPEIPQDFFNRTAEEIRREQQQRAEAMEKMTMLRTQKMREMDAVKEQLASVPYKYTFIRVRFPDNIVLQGIFNVYEKFFAVREFVNKNLAFQHGVYTLRSLRVNGEQQNPSDESTLLEHGLLPAAILFFCWDDATMADLNQRGQPISYLLNELETDAELLT